MQQQEKKGLNILECIGTELKIFKVKGFYGKVGIELRIADGVVQSQITVTSQKEIIIKEAGTKR